MTLLVSYQEVNPKKIFKVIAAIYDLTDKQMADILKIPKQDIVNYKRNAKKCTDEMFKKLLLEFPKIAPFFDMEESIVLDVEEKYVKKLKVIEEEKEEMKNELNKIIEDKNRIISALAKELGMEHIKKNL